MPQLDEVKDRVREDVIRTRAAELSRQRAGEIAEHSSRRATSPLPPRHRASKPRTPTLIARGVGAARRRRLSPEVDKVAFALPNGGVSDPITTSDGTVIVRVVDRDEATPEKFREGRKDAFRADLLNERRSRFFSAYMTKAKEKAKIEVKTDVLQRVSAAVQI